MTFLIGSLAWGWRAKAIPLRGIAAFSWLNPEIDAEFLEKRQAQPTNVFRAGLLN